MKKRINFDFDTGWVLRHRNDDVLPVDAFSKALASEKVFEEEHTFSSLRLVFENEIDEKALKEMVQAIFSELYPGDKMEEALRFTVSDAEENAGQGKAPAETKEKQGESKDKSVKQGETPDYVGEVLGEIYALVGADEFKALARELSSVVPTIIERRLSEVLFAHSILFSIGDGCGLSTYLVLLAQLLAALGFQPIPKNAVREVRLPPVRDSLEPLQGAADLLGDIPDGRFGVLCFDISEWMGATKNRYFKEFLRIVERLAANTLVVFRVPFVDKDVLEDIRRDVGDILCSRSLSIPPFDRVQLRSCAEKELLSYGFTVSKAAWKYFDVRINEEKSDGKFYGLNTVKKIVKELVYDKLRTEAKKKAIGENISCNDMKRLAGAFRENTRPGMEQLDELVGNKEFKARLQEIIAQIELSALGKSDDRPCIHMRFVGNPGTGKTTVARILGKIFKDKGILRIGNFYEYRGRDLCGRYIGETAPKTSGICRDAYGSVLFIDEAYSLYRGDDSGRDYGREAIDTLIAEMENHRDDFVVIMAGYPDDMNKLMEANAGLKSRMPITVEFPNFTREELYQIFASLAQKKFKCGEDLLQAAKTYFLTLPDELILSKEFSNGRFVRNLFERTWAKAAMRSQLGGAPLVLTRDDFERACCEKDFTLNAKKKPLIGF